MSSKWVVITGASSGIGKATALKFAQEGYRICLIARRTHHLKQVLTQIQAITPFPSIQSQMIACDLSTDEGIDLVIDTLKGESIQYLLHNAATIQPITQLLEISRQEWRHHFTLNVEAPLFITQALISELKGGRVMQISSGAAHKSIAGWGAYCASKATLYRIWASLKEELHGHQIALASVRPGVVDTEMQQEIRHATHPSFVQRPYFEDLKKKNQLISSADVADYLFDLFVHRSREEFSAHEWDIRD